MSNVKNRTVAFLDILGFKNILKKYSYDNIGKKFTEALELAQARAFEWHTTFPNIYGKDKCFVYTFSDSIAIISPDVDPSYADPELVGFLIVTLYVKYLVQSLFVFQIPVRGAIAFGETYFSSNPAIFLGCAWLKATDLEKLQQWIGVSIDKSVEERFSNFFNAKNLLPNIYNLDGGLIGNRFKYPQIMRYPVPFKVEANQEESKLLFTINWLDQFTFYDDEGNRLGNFDYINKLEKLIEDIDDKTKAKYFNTRKYVEYVDSVYSFNEDGSESHFLKNDKYTEIS